MEHFAANLQKKINQLPKKTGVYLFYEKKEIIYIGKAINIKERVKNHFQQPSYRDNLFIHKVSNIDFITTDSEIEALVLEANLIKQYLPKFNVIWKDDKNYFYVAIEKDKQGLAYVCITHQPNKIQNAKIKNQNDSLKLKISYIGPFTEGNALKKTLKFLRRVFPYYTSLKHPKNKCTWCHLGLCPGPNPNPKEYSKDIKQLALILQGKRKAVLYSLRKEMARASLAHKFEEAGRVRDKINALLQVMLHTHVIENVNLKDQTAKWDETQTMLQEILHIKKTINKIECYDISNIQGKQAVGSMVVFTDGSSDKSQYKKFRIKMKNEPNDIAMLQEVLERRFLHLEWKYPEIMLIDGGKAQLNVVIKTKNQYKRAKHIKIISIAKGRQELFIEGKKQSIPLKSLPQEIYNLVKNLDDEAHRFAITYHKKLRKNALLK